jgi:hypothetical protein
VQMERHHRQNSNQHHQNQYRRRLISFLFFCSRIKKNHNVTDPFMKDKEH